MEFRLPIGPRVRQSPFFAATVADGVTHFSIYNHMYMATGYGDPAAEYDRLINGVSMWDVSCERQVELQGPDAGKLANYLTTRELSKARIGQGYYAPLCTHDGVLINDPIALKLEEDRYWFSIADSDICLWAKAVAAERGLDVTVREPDVSPLAVQGPKAEDVVADLLGDWVREMRYFAFRQFDLDGIPLYVARSGWSKQGGFELYLCDGSKGAELWNRVKQAGGPYGIGPGTPNYVERVESALLSYGADTDDRTNPFEVGLGKYVNLDSANDFIGKAALTRIHAEGVKRRQVGLFLDGDRVASNPSQYPIVRGNDKVGMMCVTAWSPRVGRNIAIALIDNCIGDDEAGLAVIFPDGERDARITGLPFC